ncbi:hypothetical protein VMCG_00235 [Cytospora schulzeri]|uniref:Uncharacterized protein n=1 Tax=Cytospora schulzeri TaxID=448051 RepID=A0A423X959_9PEZI|nr:hypothetical protein VMCG_00235 [Valsa malicola]
MPSTAATDSAVDPGHEPGQTSMKPPRLELPTPEDPSSGSLTEGSGEEDDFYGDRDNAQSLIQPAISLVATRLTSPRTPAAERVAAMDQVVAGYFDRLGSNREDESSGEETPRAEDMMSEQHRQARPPLRAGTETKLPPSTSIPPPQPPYSTDPLPAPWKTGPKHIVVAPSSPQGHRPALSGVFESRHRRSSSAVLRKSTSDDSMLYHSLSRVSSFGDDERFTHIREQVNSRLKAIVDSFDAPTFKLPSMPTTLLSPLKKSEFSSGEIESGPSRASSLRTMRAPRDPLDSILEHLTGDLVILGGYRGSILRSTEPPHRQLWVPMKVGLNVRKVNLEVGLDPEDEERMEETIIPSGMLKNVGPVDISKRLFKRARECENARTGKLRVHDYGYDWRLSPHLLSRKLVEFLKTLPSNQGDKPSGALVIAHSLGGIITRHAVNQAPEVFSGVIYAGSPQRAINILGPLRNGDAVLLNEKVLTAHVNFSLRTTFVFLPEDGFCFVDKHTGEEYPVDFFDPNEWVRHRLCPSVGEPQLPPFSPKRNGPLGSFLSLSDSLSFPRARSSSDPAAARRLGQTAPPQRKLMKDRTLAPQMDSSASSTEQQMDNAQAASPKSDITRAKNFAYLTRVLAETKRFRAESKHNPSHQAANAYPPIAVIYGKEIPTVYAARVSCREAIACADVYDDLVFHSGDGVVLAREAMPPPGYEIARGGRISSDKGHISLLGDMNAVGRALEAVVRGRRKGIGLGVDARREASS